MNGSVEVESVSAECWRIVIGPDKLTLSAARRAEREHGRHSAQTPLVSVWLAHVFFGHFGHRDWLRLVCVEAAVGAQAADGGGDDP